MIEVVMSCSLLLRSLLTYRQLISVEPRISRVCLHTIARHRGHETADFHCRILMPRMTAESQYPKPLASCESPTFRRTRNLVNFVCLLTQGLDDWEQSRHLPGASPLYPRSGNASCPRWL